MKYTALLCAMAAIGLAACTQDELTDGTLPEGKYPLVINATGLQTATLDTRATVDGNWDGVNSVAVQVGDEVKEYSVATGTDAKTAMLSNDADPFYWEAKTMTVSAWWPYGKTMPEVEVDADQSTMENFADNDFISAENQTVNFGDNPTLVFSHRTARVTVYLQVGNNITSLEDATVSLVGLTTEGGNPATITPYRRLDSVREALLRPQTISANVPFIQVVLDGETYSYGLAEDIKLEANYRYVYTVTVSKQENLVLTSCTISDWESGGRYEAAPVEDYIDDGQGNYTIYTGAGLKAVADLISEGDYDINVKLDRDIDLTGVDWKTIKGYYRGTFDGQGHRITGLSINMEGEEFASLFSDIGENGTVKNLQLENVDYTGTDESYGIATNNLGTITACSVTGTLTASDYVAGIVYGNIGTITACWFNGTLSASSSYGIVRNNSKLPTMPNGGVISACYWGGNAEMGVDTQTSGATAKATKVNDDESWQSAIDGMNAALSDNDYEWALGTDGLPVLKKK